MTEASLLVHPFFTNVILPFLLIFVVIYAILEKSAVLGPDKRYANLLVAIIIGLLFVGVQSVVGFTLRVIPLVAMLIMILLCFYLIVGFIGLEKAKGITIALGLIFGIAFMIILLWASGLLGRIVGEVRSEVIGIVAIVATLGAAIALVLTGQKK